MSFKKVRNDKGMLLKTKYNLVAVDHYSVCVLLKNRY